MHTDVQDISARQCVPLVDTLFLFTILTDRVGTKGVHGAQSRQQQQKKKKQQQQQKKKKKQMQQQQQQKKKQQQQHWAAGPASKHGAEQQQRLGDITFIGVRVMPRGLEIEKRLFPLLSNQLKVKSNVWECQYADDTGELVDQGL